MNFQVTILKVLVTYPDGFAALADLERDAAILATSGREWSERTSDWRPACPAWKSSPKAWSSGWMTGGASPQQARCALDLMEKKPAAPEFPQAQITAPEPSPAVAHPESFIVAGPNHRRASDEGVAESPTDSGGLRTPPRRPP